ncbi:MAG: DNA topoisomerase I, partial [Archaeoglobus sp.]
MTSEPNHNGWLIITEKHNTAKRIASILFKDVKTEKKYNTTYYYSPSNKAYVVGLKGHIAELDFPEKYNNWKKVPIRDLIRAELVKNIKEKKIARLLKEIAKKVSKVTVATDYDREGELIGLEALEIVKDVNPDVKVDRAKYSAITPTDIKKAFRSTVNVDVNLAKSAEARQRIDLIWGAALTRLISISSGRMGKDFLSVGRVQSPTLRLIVEREREIENFKPIPYWEIYAKFCDDKCFIAKHIRRFEDKEEAERAFNLIGSKAVVKSFERKEKAEKKPTPFNTTEFLREASRFMSPAKAMSVAEELYMEGYISYPRTDNTVYPPTLNLKSIVSMFVGSEFDEEAKTVLHSKMVPSKGKKKSEDHPPIYPTAVADRNNLGREKWTIYELVVRRFLATLADEAVWDWRKVIVESNGLLFSATGKILINAGWRKIYTYSKAENIELPLLKKGQELRVVDKKLEEKETKPPTRYGAGNLIRIMEKLGLGTKSTRHEIINKLYSRKYVYGNPMKPTQTAFAVIDALKSSAETITLPEMTAKLESEMYAIAEGKMSEKDVVKNSIEMLDEILSKIDLDKLSKDLRTGVKLDRVVGKCPNCGKELLIKRSKNGRFIGCSGYPNCRFTLPLPQKGTIYITSQICEKHNIKKIKIRTKRGYWNLGCPYCNYLEWKSSSK